MPTTTPNYGWTVPTSTDLVKDGATAIETLGDAVDATVFSNANAAIAKTIVDAKGDIIAATAADTVSRLAVGANNTVLTADSTTATGLKWAAAGGGAATGWTLLNAGGTALTGSTTITVSGLSAKELMIFVASARSATTYSEIRIRVNSISTADYSTFGIYNVLPTTYNAGYWDNYQQYSSENQILLAQKGSSATSVVSGYCYIDKADTTGNKIYQLAGSGDATGSADNFSQMTTGGLIEMSAAITSVSIISSAGNFDNGTVYILGAN